MTSWANKEIFKRLLVLVSAADLVIPHGTPVTTASLPKGGVRRDLSILGDRPDVGKKYEKMCFKWVRKWIPWFSIRANTSWVRKFPSKGSKTLDSKFLMLHKCCKKCSNHQVSCLTRNGCAIFYWPRNGVWLRRGKQPASWFCLVGVPARTSLRDVVWSLWNGSTPFKTYVAIWIVYE